MILKVPLNECTIQISKPFFHPRGGARGQVGMGQEWRGTEPQQTEGEPGE